jgi:hypothetical protein
LPVAGVVAGCDAGKAGATADIAMTGVLTAAAAGAPPKPRPLVLGLLLGHVVGGVGTVPVGLTSIRDSPRFSLFPVGEAEMASVFELFDELDGWLRSTLPDAFAWIEAGLDVRFDRDFRVVAKAAHDAGEFTDFLEHADHRQAVVDNMDF